MARDASIAKAGYYPLDSQGFDDLAAVLRPSSDTGNLSVLDPCAGRGEVLRLAHALGRTYYAGVDQSTAYSYGRSPRNPAVDLRMCELESSRAEAAQARWQVEDHTAQAAWRTATEDDATASARRSRGFQRPVAACVAQGDAFRLAVPTAPWAMLLYLNPPYDHDDAKRGGRLEERWLERFSAFVVGGGILAFVVPLAAVGACAPLLAQRWTDVQIGRVRAGAASAAFSPTQVVVLARRLRPDLLAPDGAAERRIRALVDAGVDSLPGVADLAPVEIPTTHTRAPWDFAWKPQELDYDGACGEFRPWHRSARRSAPGAKRAPPLVPLREALPADRTWAQLTAREFPTLMSLKPSYVADAIASGALDGELLEPADAADALPAVYVKGMFDRQFREVEVKFDSEGNPRASVQVQRPALKVSVLDPTAGAVYVLRDSALPTGSPTIDGFSVGDLVARYGPSLAAALGRRCPVTGDADGVELPALRRPLFAAQARVVRAIAGRLRRLSVSRRRAGGRTPAVLLQGQPGTGKTAMCLATARTVDARRVLVICPPHLVAEEAAWRSDSLAVLGAGAVDDHPELGPGCDVRVLETPADVSRFVDDADDGRMRIGVASREVAKLGHGYEGFRKCARCGAVDERAPEKLASTRGRCKAPALLATGSRHLRRAAECLATALVWALPSAEVDERLPPGSFAVRGRGQRRERAGIGHGAALQAVAYVGHGVHSLRKKTLTEAQSKNVDLLASMADELRTALSGNASGAPLAGMRLLTALRAVTPMQAAGAPRRTKDDGWKRGVECGEPLWQAAPRPRRWPLVRSLVAAAQRGAFDLLILDEAHEYGNSDSAQAQAAEQLVACGIPTILATGTVCNGYMSSMHTHFRALSEDYARDFGRDDRPRAVARFGYQRRQVDLKAAASDAPTAGGTDVELGAVSDRVVRGGVRVIGQAPGVLPEALLRYLAPATAQIHLEDLGEELPSIADHLIECEPTPTQAAGLKYLVAELKEQIRADRKDKDKVGKLFGQFAELPSFLDRCVLAPEWVVSYPSPFGQPARKGKRKAEERGPVVASLPHGTIGIPSPDDVLPKEAALVEWVVGQLSQGRPCLVYVWHWDLMTRIRAALERGLAAMDIGCGVGVWRPGSPDGTQRWAGTAARVSVMDPGKVAPAKREAWIAAEAKKRCAVLLTNPAAVKTGINSLARWWCSAGWVEGPGCSPEIRRQATHRLWRMGQGRPVEVASFVYAGTMQAAMHELLMRKVGVSEAVDGLDATAALAAAGVGEQDAGASLEVGRALYEWCERVGG